MDEDLENIPIDARQHIHDLFKEVTDENGLPVMVSRLFDRFAPALFDSSSLDTLTTSPPNDRNTGYLAFYQSFSTYTINHYNTLSTAFLEHILVQTASLLPITNIAMCLRLGDNQYDSCYESGDRLLILLGVLVSFYGSSAVDSFMHPLFEKHIFNDIQLPQPDQGQAVIQFENLIRSRGVMDIYYQQLEITCPQTQCRWECTITYRLGPNTSMLLHHRTGKSKKQAKIRTLHDIYNYYTRNDTEFFLHSNAWDADHPHANISKINTTTLSIPTELMYEYDDDSYENTSLAERQQQRRSNPNYAHIPLDVADDPAQYMAQVLLGDSNNSNNIHDSPQASPLPAATQQHDDQQSLLPSVPSSPLPSKSDWASSSTLTSPKLGTGPATVGDRSPIMKKDQHTTPTTNANSSSSSSSSNKKETMDSSGKELRIPTTPLSPPPSSLEKSPLLATEEHLMAKAKQLMDELTVKERCRMNDYKENLHRNPNDAKGCLMNLARKMEDGHYHSTAEHVQLGKAGTRANYIVTVRFGTRQVEMVLARGHTKKSTAEALAALAIFELLQKVSKTINAEMNLPFLD